MTEFLEDLRVMTTYAPPDAVAKSYINANPEVRGMIAEILDGFPKEKREAVIAYAERLGVTLRGAWACGDGKPVGSGLSKALSSVPSQSGTCNPP